MYHPQFFTIQFFLIAFKIIFIDLSSIKLYIYLRKMIIEKNFKGGK